MREHKVIQILKTFDKNRFKRFRQFIISPYHLNSPKVASLASFLLQFAPHFDHEDLNEEFAFNALYPGKSFEKQELIRYASKLFEVIEDFLAVESLLQNDKQRLRYLQIFYYKNQFESGFNKIHRRLSKKVSQITTEENDEYFYSYLNSKEAYNFAKTQGKFEDAHQYLLEAGKSLNYFFCAEMVRAAIGARFHIIKDSLPKEEESLFDHGLQFVEQFIAENEVPNLIQLWWYALKLEENPYSEEAYQLLKTELKLWMHDIPAFNAQNFVVILTRSLKKIYGQNRKKYLKERFDLYLIQIQEGWIISGKIIRHNTFTNIVIAALTLGHLDWTENFINKYREFLPLPAREHTVMYAQARLAFSRKEYSTCLKYIAQIGFYDVTTTLNVKRLYIQCMAETQEIVTLQTAIHALNMYLRRMDDQYASLRKTNEVYLKAIKLVGQTLENSHKEKVLSELHTLLQDHPMLPEREWLVEFYNSKAD